MPTFGQRFGVSRFEADEAYRQALEAMVHHAYDQAYDWFNRAIEALPTGSEYHAGRGLIHLEEAEYALAQADFEEALRLYPHEMLAHFGLGIVAFRHHKDYAQAVQHFLSAYYIQRERAETLYWLAMSYYQQGDLVNAANFLARADARFEQLNDKRRAETQRWIKELAKHAARPASKPAVAPLPSPQARLPLQADDEAV